MKRIYNIEKLIWRRNIDFLQMFSYLINRQYHKLTDLLPEDFKVDQPQRVYFPSHANNNKENTLEHFKRTHKTSGTRLKIKKKAIIAQMTSLGNCCPTCFSQQNILVKFYLKKHVCVNCRKFLRDQHGNQVKIFLNNDGNIVCLGIKKYQTLQKPDHKVYYETDYMKLDLNGKSAFATFAAQNEMIILLRGQQF